MSYERLKNLLKSFIFTKNITPRRFINFCLIIFQHTVTKNSFVIGYPIKLVIDPINICNMHCPLCPTGQGRKERSKGKMVFKNFKKIIDELGHYLYEIDLHNWGEPLMNEEIYAMIDYARKHKISVDLSTNLNFFNEGSAEYLVRSGLNHLIVSLDGASQTTYQKYRIGGNFEQVIENMKMIIQKREELNTSTPFITWQFLVMRHNEYEIPKAKKIAEALGIDRFLLAPLHSDMGRELLESCETKIEKTKEWLPHNVKYSFYNLRNSRKRAQSRTCSFLWIQSVVNWNGSVSPCCAVYEEKYDFGNMFETSFKEIWNNDKYRASRRMIRRKRVDKSSPQTICAHCLTNGFL